MSSTAGLSTPVVVSPFAWPEVRAGGAGALVQRLHLIGLTPSGDGLIFTNDVDDDAGRFVLPLDVRVAAQLSDVLLALRDRLGGAVHDGAEGTAQPERTPPPALPPSLVTPVPPPSTAPPSIAPPAGIIPTPEPVLDLRDPSAIIGPGSRSLRSIPPPVRPASRLTPREIQDRLRAGHTISQIAAEADVSEDWVERFAPPILAEQTGALFRGLHLPVLRAGGGLSSEPLHQAVRNRLTAAGVEVPDQAFDQAWSALRLGPGRFVLRFRLPDRPGREPAEWQLDMRANEVSPRNELAAKLTAASAPQITPPLGSVQANAGDPEGIPQADPTGATGSTNEGRPAQAPPPNPSAEVTGQPPSGQVPPGPRSPDQTRSDQTRSSQLRSGPFGSGRVPPDQGSPGRSTAARPAARSSTARSGSGWPGPAPLTSLRSVPVARPTDAGGPARPPSSP